jgi:outer membrane protein assembly factor BamB
MYGRDASRNAVSPETDPPTGVAPGEGIAWEAALGDLCIGSPVVSDGLVWVGTNNRALRDPARREDASALYCFRERDGAFLWQHLTPTLDADFRRFGNFSDIPLRCSPLVEGDRLWFVTNRWEALALDIGPLRRGEGAPRELWRTDLVERLGTRPYAAASGMGFGVITSIGATWRGRLYVSTGHCPPLEKNEPARPDAPALVCLDAGSGEILARERSGIAAGSVGANWSSPVVAADGPRTLVVFAGGDGLLRAFDPELREVWRVDCKSKDVMKGFMGTPVVHEGRVYAALGDAEDSGPGSLSCVELATGRELWRSTEVGAGGSSPIVHGGNVYFADGEGYLHCLDVAGGARLWTYDSLNRFEGSPLLADGLLYVAAGNEELTILDVRALTERARTLGPSVKIERSRGRIVLFSENGLAETSMGQPVRVRRFSQSIYASPVLANGTLYVAVSRRLYALRRGSGPQPEPPAEQGGVASDALFVPTPGDVVERMLELASPKPAETLFDLGSGDGRIVIAAAKRYGCRAVGYEIDRSLVERSRAAISGEGLSDRARIEYEDLLKADLSGAGVVTLYVGSRLTRLLLPKLEALPPGVRIVSHDATFRKVAPERTVKMTSREDGREHVLYLWTTPLKRSP